MDRWMEWSLPYPATDLSKSSKASLPWWLQRQRVYEEEDDDEMEDFIEDEGEPQEELSKHIQEIFGYDRKNTKMKVIMPYVTWRVVGKSSKRKKQRGKYKILHMWAGMS